MAKSGKSTDEIQELLQEKQQIEQWLERLDNAADAAASEVRSRVAQDYQARLDGVVGKLQGYRDDLAATLESQRDRRTELESAEASASERLSEAELRHAVGEYDEATYSKMRTDILEELVGIRGDLKTVRGEIDTLDGVIRQIDAPVSAAPTEEDVETSTEAPAAEPEPEPTPEPEPEPEPDPEPDPEPEPESEPEKPSEPRLSLEVPEVPAAEDAAEDAGSAGGDDADAPKEDFDELAFLKSVTDQSDAGDDAGSEDTSGGGQGKPKKTLVCMECGANNLPTEWYCERCGAELAAV
jgi:hypothetical protein